MLGKKDIRKKAHQLIRKEKSDHQSAYDQLKRMKSFCPKEEVAKIVSRIPTDAKNQKTLGLRIIFVITLIFIFVIRLTDFLVILPEPGIFSTLIFLFHGLVLPTLGIYGALTSRTRYYKLVAIFMFLSTLGTLLTLFVVFHPSILLIALPFALVGVLGFVIPHKLKVTYKKKMVQREFKGRNVNVYEYFFDESDHYASEEHADLLDF